MFSKGSFWAELLTEIGRPSQVVDGAILRGLPALAAGSGAVALWQWNNALGLAAVVGVSGSFALFQISQRLRVAHVRHWLNRRLSHDSRLVFSLSCGAALLMLVYAALSVWQALKSPWLAMLLLTQTLGIFLLVGLALWLVSRSGGAPIYSFDRCVAGLLHRDELQRLVAVRQIGSLAVRQQISARERKIAAEYLQILLRKQSDPIIQGAIQESLAALEIQAQLGPHSVTLGALQPLLVQKQSQKQKLSVEASLHSCG